MKQAVPKQIAKKSKTKAKIRGRIGKRHHKKYGTSKLEQDFAHDFLEKLGLDFIYQYEAKDIKRYFDFAVVMKTKYEYEVKDGIKSVRQDGQSAPIDLIIEIDGSYYHGDPRIVNEDKLNPMQKHNKFVDGLKDRWCNIKSLPLLRIWEYDIRHNPKKVMEELKKYVGKANDRRAANEWRSKPH